MAETTQIQKSTPVLPWMRNPVDIVDFKETPLTMLPFLDPRLVKALKNVHISSLFPVQVAVWQETIGPGAFERDLCVNSPTGSGKTLSYALPIVQKLATHSVKCLRALVVLPTRDLAVQVKNVFDVIAPAVGLSVGLAVGQSSLADEISALVKAPRLEAGFCYDPEDHANKLRSAVDILVATPGRLMDHINTTKGFTLEHLRYLVVDETDRLLGEAYQSWLPAVLKLSSLNDEVFAPCVEAFSASICGSFKTIRRFGVERGFKDKANPRLVKMLFSATLTRNPSKLGLLDLHHPLFLTTGQSRYAFPEKLEFFKVICESNDKALYLVALLQKLKGEKCIVFTSSKKMTHRLCSLLKCFGNLEMRIKGYSSCQHQAVRSKTLDAFRKGEVEVLISSDNLSRGTDVEAVANVIIYDVPRYIKAYLHRAGRTARAFQIGRCFTLLLKDEMKKFKALQQKAEISSTVFPLSSESIQSLQPAYTSAFDKLKENVESEAFRKRKVNFKSTKPRRAKTAKISKE
ncbi:DEAD-box ATP-dependent RNA helicase 1-like isoform X1 [Chenopodium quinoa]|uniref:DEAD-box ATP-dependent RNA helicase 1-like isoform X1 n=1 Tax=Chenopodium quinoa TaxID=63459 RepID=UPI000B775705|nr:DEAD-box ATP-dependent RNA helicase 1-like isoform X1 [Chenopodium quinoa]XP_021750908.1 DEAD-box ATP-dependent RNA helicase 1-like isoform X1 [Chenopodium quinoa]XP_021750909.1 DEAD-box ATP-dependent RNA helicase 1-like isoform X1 [Chenopodium quinoa]XP_021750910.1 DEAD-box ATP-dependent RNA helicase 1-like isoform X1 [Chenopodium quinoa]